MKNLGIRDKTSRIRNTAADLYFHVTGITVKTLFNFDRTAKEQS
jgi:hypothetical protein